jgi:hypothetical protein
MAFYIEVLDCAPPDPSPLLSAYRAANDESLAREQDKILQTPVERFATLVSSLRAGESRVTESSWKHLSPTVLMCAEPTLLLAMIELVADAVTTLGPVTPGSPTIALISASSNSWRDAVTAGLKDEWPVVAGIYADLYRSFCKRGYAAMWNEYKAKTQGNRLLLEHK